MGFDNSERGAGIYFRKRVPQTWQAEKYECLCRLETRGRCFSLNCEPNLVLESEKETKSRIIKWACGLLKEEMKNKMSYISSLCINGRICNCERRSL